LNSSEVVHDIYDVMTSLLTFSLRKEDATSERRRALEDQVDMDNSTSMDNITDIENDTSE
jgi:hypothetical protein